MDFFNQTFSQNFLATIGKTFGTNAEYTSPDVNDYVFTIPGTFVGYVEQTDKSGNNEEIKVIDAEFKCAKSLFDDFDIPYPAKNEKLIINSKTYNIEQIRDTETSILDFMLTEIETEKIELSVKRRIR